MNKFLALLKSRKFWAAIVGLLVMIGSQMIPELEQVDQEALVGIIAIVVSYILGTGIEDGLRG